jgi:pyruvate-ferredoxin/flavodoxin oxidoreductase
MGGKPTPKKDLGLRAMMNGDVYVAQVALGADDTQTITAMREAESYDGTSIVIAYSTCIAHGINMEKGMNHMDKAVQSGHWPLYRFDPRRAEDGDNPLQLDSNEPQIDIEEFMYSENRFRMLKQSKPERAKRFLEEARRDVQNKWELYETLANRSTNEEASGDQSTDHSNTEDDS